jgi:hypothetical protein
MFNHFHNEGSPQLLTKYRRAFTLKEFTLSPSRLFCLQKTSFLRHFVLCHAGVVCGTNSTFTGKNWWNLKTEPRPNFALQRVLDFFSKTRTIPKQLHHPSKLAQESSVASGILNAQERRFEDNSYLYKSTVLRPSALGRILPLRSYVYLEMRGILSSFGSLGIPIIFKVISLRDYLLRRALDLIGFRSCPDQHKDKSGLAAREWCVAPCAFRDSSANFVTQLFRKTRYLFSGARHPQARSQVKFPKAFKPKQMLISYSPSILTL